MKLSFLGAAGEVTEGSGEFVFLRVGAFQWLDQTNRQVEGQRAVANDQEADGNGLGIARFKDRGGLQE